MIEKKDQNDFEPEYKHNLTDCTDLLKTRPQSAATSEINLEKGGSKKN